MASQEQLELSHFIKSVHQNLRNEAKISDPNDAWLKHCKDEATLEKYAAAMQKLATKYWKSHSTSDAKATCRIDWIHKICCDYFNVDGLQKHRQREKDIAMKANITVPLLCTDFTKPYYLLDVGSCYNPFSVFPEFKTTAVDIAPATACVHKCDFLNVATTNSACNKTKHLLLPENYYHIVVFSLVLEYLPSANQRLLFCEKAYKLLKPEGLLFIITPDSKHVGANFKIMKTWKFIMAKIGFSRITYEKQSHIHCMAFRKSISFKITQRWAELHKDHNFYNAFVIPQDFNELRKNAEKLQPEQDCGNNEELLSELPGFSHNGELF